MGAFIALHVFLLANAVPDLPGFAISFFVSQVLIIQGITERLLRASNYQLS
jgi:hypothetical protein